MVLPTLVYNALHLGYSWQQKPNVENVLLGSTNLIFTGESGAITIKLQYNKNFIFLEKTKTVFYIPSWTSVRRINSYGDESSTSSLHIAFGSGFGMKFKRKRNENLRVELGLGAALNLETKYHGSDNYPIYHLNNFRRPNKNPLFFPAFRLNIRYLIGL